MYAHAKVSVFDNAEKLSPTDQKFGRKSRDLVEERQRCPLDANKTVPDKTKKHASNFSTTKAKNKGHAKYETESQE